MPTTMKQPTLTEFKHWSRENYRLAHAVCLAQAFAECERKRVDAYIQPIFEKYGFRADLTVDRETEWHNKPLTTPRDLYLSEDPRIPAYYEECDAAHRAHGFTGPKGHCPALVAENLLIEAQNALLDSGAELIGIDRGLLYGVNREKILNLLLGAALKQGR